MTHLLNDTWSFVLLHWQTILSILVIFAAWVLSKKGKAQDVDYANTAMQLAKSLLEVTLGPKFTVVFAAWTVAMEAIKDGNFSLQDMVAEFVKIIQAETQKSNIVLTQTELESVTKVATATVELLTAKAQPTINALNNIS